MSTLLQRAGYPFWSHVSEAEDEDAGQPRLAGGNQLTDVQLDFCREAMQNRVEGEQQARDEALDRTKLEREVERLRQENQKLQLAMGGTEEEGHRT